MLTIFLYIFCLFLILFLLFVALNLFYLSTWLFSNPPSVPTDRNSRKRIIELIQKYKTKNYSKKDNIKIYDLGSGVGHLAIDISKAMPKAKILGIEYLILPYFISKLKLFFFKLLNQNDLQLIRKNFFQQDISDADIVVVFFIQSRMSELEKFIADSFSRNNNCTENKKIKIVISNNFHFPNRKYLEKIEIKTLIGKRTLYVYEF